jgi:hypothetical protein
VVVLDTLLGPVRVVAVEDLVAAGDSVVVEGSAAVEDLHLGLRSPAVASTHPLSLP